MAPFSTTSPTSVTSIAPHFGRSRTTSMYNRDTSKPSSPTMLQISTKFGSPQAVAAGSPSAGPIASHVVSINWENVLLPSAWLAAQMRVDMSVQSLQNAQQLIAQTPQLKALLAGIEENAIELLTKAMEAAGAVYIFSEGTVQSVELSCSVFFPRLTACLRNATRGVFVIGTPETSFSPQELAEWKVNILRTVCGERIAAGNDLARAKTRRFGVIALCASDRDVAASDKLTAVAPYAVTKSVKAAVGGASPLSLEAFSAQLQKLAQFVTQALAFNGAIRIAL
ncbi:hypothetical protein PybrP1_003824 [[Pythium] brassicae (nom. inval.)]|nr:hypothetical protein PybrP1_003824 [[Pythium] brassicae (nom. inval.)]